VSIGANTTLGSANDPFIMIVDGSVNLGGTPLIYGIMYSTAINWDCTGCGSATLVGAAISEGNYTGNGTPDFFYDPAVMQRLQAIPGDFVRVPGSWRDF
jgi:hypothetical protein